MTPRNQRRTQRTAWIFAFAASLSACAEAPLRAALPYDSNGAYIAGYVSDALTGKPVSGALVVATSPEHGEQTALTDDDGDYMFVGLPGGVYRVQAEASNYLPFDQKSIRARAGQRLRVNLPLAPETLCRNTICDPIIITVPPVTDVGSATAGTNLTNESLRTLVR